MHGRKIGPNFELVIFYRYRDGRFFHSKYAEKHFLTSLNNVFTSIVDAQFSGANVKAM
jgi:hypothetical protein